MNKQNGVVIMKVGWMATTFIALIFLIFYRGDLAPESRMPLDALFALAWIAASVVYEGGTRLKRQLEKRIAELESSQSSGQNAE